MKRTNSILLTKYILKILESNDEVKSIFKDRIYSLDANFGTKFPFCAIIRTGMRPASSKDGLYEDNIYFSVVIVSDLYDTAVEGANIIRYALDHKYYVDDIICIRSIMLDNATEQYLDDKFYQELMFTANVQLPQN